MVRDAKNHSCFHSFGRHAKRRADMQGWPPEMQKKKMHLGRPTLHVGPPILLFYYFTILLFYYFTPGTVLPRPMFGVGRPRCKKVFHIPPRTTAERSFCISDGQPCMSALLFYFFTNLLFCFFTPRPTPKVWVSGLRGFSTPKKPVQQGIRTLSGPLTIRQADTYISH